MSHPERDGRGASRAPLPVPQSSPKKFRPIESSACWASMLSAVSSPVSSSTPIAISTTPETRGDDQVAVAQPAERRRRARERDGGEQERHGQPGGVERAAGSRPCRRVSWTEAAVRIAPSVGPTHGVQATANAAPATSGPPEPAREISASGRHSRLSRGTNGVITNNTPSAMIIDAGDLVERAAAVLQRRAEAGRGHPERDEDDGERQAEDDRREQHARQRARRAGSRRAMTPETADR